VKKDLVGKKFGKLTVARYLGSKNKRSNWECLCDCGKVKEVLSKHLLTGGTSSCGCFLREASAQRASARAKTIESRLKLQENGCLIWQGSKDKDGYGTIKLNKKDWKVHRLIYKNAYGDIPYNKLVCHTCDTPSCANINHLFLGSAIDNSQDSVRKNRQAKGEKNGNAKINDYIVKQIKRLYYNDKLSQKKIGEIFGIYQTTVSSVLRGESWNHV
jgi:predicted XRE-type DNA-binding protein